MAVHVFKGNSQMRASDWAIPVTAMYRDRISTSKIHFDLNGARNIRRTGSVARKILAPHCVS